jgi:hypothetical protein
MIGYSRVDANPPISVSADVSISSISVETIETITDETYDHENYAPTIITIHQENIIIEQEQEQESEQEFEPINKYYDELKNGYLEFDDELQKYLWEECEKNDVDFYLVMAQICEESTYDKTACGHNKNGTRDMGLAQINSRYLNYFSDLMDKDIDPYDPYDAIDWLIFFHNYEEEYWTDRGLTGDKLDMAILGSYNKGRDNMIDYIRNHGYGYYYNNDIIFREEQLMEEHGL